MKKHFHLLGDWRRNVLLVAAASSLGLTLPACSGGNDNSAQGSGGDWGDQSAATQAPQTYSQGVISELTEVKPGEWKITAERPAGKEEVAAILKHYDGKVDTLQGQALQRQMQEYSRVNPENRTGDFSMMNVLMWGGIGYMAGRWLSPSPGYYASPGILQRNQGWRSTVGREREREGRSFFGRGFSNSGVGTTTAATAAAARNAGIQESRSTVRNAPRPTFRSSAPAGRSSGFGSRGGFGRSGGFGS